MGATVPVKSGARDADDARMRGNRRAASMVAVMASVVVLVVAGVVSATAVERRVAEDERRARAAAGRVDELALPVPTTTAPAERAPTATPPATVAPVATEPRPSTTTVAALRPPRASSTVTTTPSAPPPDAVAVPGLPPVDRHFQLGRTSWSTSAGGWSITVRVDNPAPVVGQPVRFDFEVTSTVDPCCGVSALFTGAPTYSARSGDACPGTEPRLAGTARFHTSVEFGRPGWQSFNVTAHTGGCWPDPPRAYLAGEIEVKPQPLSVQGPRPPEILLMPASVPGHLGDRAGLSMGGDVRDPDGGRVRSVTVDWGDGSPVSIPNEPLPPACTVAADGSTTSEAMRFGGVVHNYALPGRYVVTVTAVSTACDGVSMPQTSSSEVTWSTESGLGTPFG